VHADVAYTGIFSNAQHNSNYITVQNSVKSKLCIIKSSRFAVCRSLCNKDERDLSTAQLGPFVDRCRQADVSSSARDDHTLRSPVGPTCSGAINAVAVDAAIYASPAHYRSFYGVVASHDVSLALLATHQHMRQPSTSRSSICCFIHTPAATLSSLTLIIRKRRLYRL